MTARRARRRKAARGSKRRKNRSRARRGSTAPSLRGLLVGALVAGAGLGAGYLFAVLLLFPAPGPPRDTRPAPDLRDRPVEAAMAMTLEAGLETGEVRTLRHPTVDSGSVLGQSPLPGQLARLGDTVDLVVSLGPERRRIPEVARLRSDRAVELLRATGFEVLVDSVDSPIARGRVIGIDPDEGTPLALPGQVALTVSLGPPTVQMPFILGMMEEEARDTLAILGLEIVEVEEVFRFGRDQGRVVTQDPAEDTELERGAPVRIEIGRRGGIPQEH
ncbi:MAG: PASTA domain-containing protein [Longimicrobiales bacterium]|nr:PASTA domain-containing protein [Longimicrobiales bacterium]